MFKLKKRRPSADMPPAKRIDKTGLAPGALIHLGERKTEEATISLLEYGVDALFEHRFTSIAEADAYQPRLPVIWLNVHGLHETQVMAEIGRRFKLHPLVLEDILNTHQRSEDRRLRRLSIHRRALYFARRREQRDRLRSGQHGAGA